MDQVGPLSFFNFVPFIIIQSIVVLIVFIVCRKRKINPTAWTLWTAIPIVGVFTSYIFLLVTLFSILDRLNKIEDFQRKAL